LASRCTSFNTHMGQPLVLIMERGRGREEL
jgi:hypothetical protein